MYEDLGSLERLSDPSPPGGYPYVQPLHAILKPGKKPQIAVDFKCNFNDFLETSRSATSQDRTRWTWRSSAPGRPPLSSSTSRRAFCRFRCTLMT
jgi:hypothetical protein